MDKILNDLGGIVLNGLPTAIIILILTIFVRLLYIKPLEAVLAERHRLTEGARQAAEQSLHSADSKIAAYQTALDEARSKIYAEQADFLAKLNAEQSARAQAAKTASDATLAQARQQLAAEVEAARANLSTQSEQLASQIADSMLAPRVV